MAKKTDKGPTAGKKIAPCEECGGPRRGPTAHKPDCSYYKQPGTGAGKGKARKASGGYDKASVSRLDVAALVGLRDTVEAVLRDKKPEIDAKIKELEDLRASISKT